MPRIIPEAFSNYLFGSPDRTLSFVSLVVSVISALATAFILIYPEKVPLFIVTRDVIVLLSLVTLSAVLFISLNNRIGQVEHSQRSLADQILNASTLIQNFNEQSFEYFQPIVQGYFQHGLNAEQLKAFSDICFFATMGVRTSIVQYLKSRGFNADDDISVSVKLIVASAYVANMLKPTAKQQQISQEPLWIMTVYRDPTTFSKLSHEREVYNALYSIPQNTAFKKVILEHNDFYKANDLIYESGHHGYVNENPKWRDQYNATVVVPIKLNHLTSGERLYFGLLALDSKKKYKQPIFDTQCQLLLSHAADVLANFFLTLAPLQKLSITEAEQSSEQSTSKSSIDNIPST